MKSPAGALLRFACSHITPTFPDAELLERFTRQRDHDAFAEIVRRHGRLVFGVCRRIARDGHEAEDAFQATFLVLASKAASLLKPERLAAWLHGVAARIALKARLQRQRRELIGPIADEPAAREDAETIACDIRPLLDDAVRSLPAKYREPIVLCYLQGLTNDEAARALGCPPGTIATRLSRARQQLRRRLVRRGVVAPAATFALVLGHSAAAVEPPAALIERAVHLPAQPAATITELIRGVEPGMVITKTRWIVAALVIMTAGGVGLMSFRAGAQELRPPVAAPAADATKDKPAITTPNFIVEGVPPRMARLIAEAAERQRKEIAERWLGKSLPDWDAPCRITVRIDGATEMKGATTLTFPKQKVVMTMLLEGTLDRILADALPHEVTHTVIATHFGKPVIRWADEGIAVMSESPEEQARYEKMMREILGSGRSIKLAKLFAEKNYPSDVTVLFAQGYSAARYLVGRKDRPTLLNFVKDGMDGDWNKAAKAHYGFEDVADLEKAWLEDLRKRAPARDDEFGLGEAEGLTRTPAPEFGLALANGDRITVVRVLTQTNSVTSYEEREKDGRKYYEPVTTFRTTSRPSVARYPLSAVKAQETDGKPAKDLANRLARQTPVLIAPVGEKIDAFYLNFIKPGTLILTVPPPEPAVAPPTAPAPPDFFRPGSIEYSIPIVPFKP
jgi:RNA polymerase sigma factor (sigma-70 family)